MNDLQIFSYHSNEVRIVGKDGEPWWVLRDICEILELTTPGKVAQRLNPKGVSSTHILSNRGGMQETTIINEENLYRAILRSDKPKAEPFIAWVTGEVLPTIRKKGGYGLARSTEARLDRIETFMEKTFASIPTLLAETVKQTIEALPQTQIALPAFIEIDYFSIKAYALKCGLKVIFSDAKHLGKEAARLSRSKNIEIRKIYDEQFGAVNSYHISVLKEVFTI